MGITGLIPFLEKSSTKINLKDIENKTVAIDAYCWLHKGAFACADRLVRGDSTDIHIKYCLKYVNLLLHYNIKPILVFDGKHLPAKSQTEKKRKHQRDESKKRAMELLRLGNSAEARNYFRRCVNITHEMALQLIQECHKLNVDCIVAPYEADAQLAYLNKLDIAEYIITEDSDLLLFGCKKIIFKLNLFGAGLLIETDKLHLSMGCRPEKYTLEKFRYMCILSGCDYLDSLPGIGLVKACKFILKTEETNMERALDKIPSYLNKPQLQITDEYKLNFMKANATFLFMFVYNPIKRELCRLNEPTDMDNTEFYSNAGTEFDNEIAFQLALGNLNPFTLKQLDNWHPDKILLNNKNCKLKSPSSSSNTNSIWSLNYDAENGKRKKQQTSIFDWAKNSKIKNKPSIINKDDNDQDSDLKLNYLEVADSNLLSTYGRDCNEQQPIKKFKSSPSHQQLIVDDSDDDENGEKLQDDSNNKIIRNPFFKTFISEKLLITIPAAASTIRNTSLVKNIEPLKKLSKFHRTIIDETKPKVISRFFVNNVNNSLEYVNNTENTAIANSGVLELKTKQIYDFPQINLIQVEDDEDKHSDNDNNNEKDNDNDNNNDNDNVNDNYDNNNINNNNNNVTGADDNTKLILDQLDKFKSTKAIITSNENNNINSNLSVIDLTTSQPFNSNKLKCRRPGLKNVKKKPNNFPISQTRLSMFGFQNKPKLK